MGKNEDILQKITEWATNNENIRAVVLEGSIAQKDSDQFSDLDINLFLTNPDSLLTNDNWISDIAPVWVYSPDKFDYEGKTLYSRLVIYEHGLKVDYSLMDLEIIPKLLSNKHYDSGYKVLVDKDNLFEEISQPSYSYSPPKKPTQEEFDFAVNEYWFEEYHVAKYLKRDDLWLVKYRDWAIKLYLLKMMEWYMLAKNDWNYNVKWDGKQIKKWVDEEIYKKIFETFGHFDAQDGWKALDATNRLFGELSKRTAKLLGYSYKETVKKNLENFTSKIKNS